MPGTSRKRRNVHILGLQMAREIKLDKERAKRLKELRGCDENGHGGFPSQRAVADAIGVEARSIQHWERGLGISGPNLEALATYWNVTANWIQYGDERPEGARSQLDRLEAKLDALTDLNQRIALSLEGLERAAEAPSRRRRATGNGADGTESGH